MSVTDLNGRRGHGDSRRPPHNLQAEQSLLGAMMLSKDTVAFAAEKLQPDDFYKPAHGHIFDAITSLAAAGEPADAVSVAGELERAGLLGQIGGHAYLFEILNNPGTPSSANRYARDIADCAALCRLIAIGGELAELGYDGLGDARGALDQAEAKVFNLTQRQVTDTTSQVGDLLDAGLDRLEQLYEQGLAFTGLPTGFVDLDENLSGLQPGALYVIGGRPSMGKTAFVLNMASHAVLNEKAPTLLFSLEMGKLELVMRMLCAEARVDSKRVRSGQLSENDWGRIADTIGRIQDAPLWIDDNPNLTIMELRAKARRLQSKVGKLGLVVVDYLQLMTGRSNAESRQVEVSEISRGLKILARELECPVIALSQLSRKLEDRADKRPMLSDLRESGSQEQDADVVMFIYRDEVYNQASPDRGTAEIIVAKQRNGPVGMARLAFLEQYTRFTNLARGA